ncbi:unnamed protein product [Pleuronectes platessa]|uniref:Uncharacterized protein n=1 Tax=Pleuronectes platessa TaxID=8262 RepID=A0A9N7YXF2_PLEPL|nr:unnamed protein product [Pleuronectes platessa]
MFAIIGVEFYMGKFHTTCFRLDTGFDFPLLVSERGARSGVIRCDSLLMYMTNGGGTKGQGVQGAGVVERGKAVAAVELGRTRCLGIGRIRRPPVRAPDRTETRPGRGGRRVESAAGLMW